MLWDPVQSQYANGQIQGYKVYYREQYYYYYQAEMIVNTTGANVLQVALIGLKAGKRYLIQVSAFTAVGEGPRSQSLAITIGEYKRTAVGRTKPNDSFVWIKRYISFDLHRYATLYLAHDFYDS